MQIRNDSEVRFELTGGGSADGVSGPKAVLLSAQRTSLLPIRASKTASPGVVRLDLGYTVSNLLVEPDVGLPIELTVEVEVAAAEE